MNSKYQILLRGCDRRASTLQQTYAAQECLDVRDLTTRATLHVRAHELSPYRHTLMLNGMEYQILNVIGQR